MPQWIEQFLIEAEKEARRSVESDVVNKVGSGIGKTVRSNSKSHSAAMSVALEFVPIPFLGAAIEMGVDKVVEKVKERNRKKKGAANSDETQYQQIRKEAKWASKSLRDVAAEIEFQQHRLKEYAHIATKNQRKVVFKDDIPEDMLWKAAVSMFRYQHNLEKLEVRVGALKGYLESLEKYMGQCINSAVQAERVFRNSLADSYISPSHITPPREGQAGMTGRSRVEQAYHEGEMRKLRNYKDDNGIR